MRMDAALESLVARVGVIESTVAQRFPLFADPDTGVWTTTRRGSWVGGFWVGLLWLRARLTGSQADRDAAAQWSSRLVPRAGDDTDTRAMTFWYGAGVGHLLTGDPRARRIALSGAIAVSESFDGAMIPVGMGLYGTGGGAPVACPDALAAIVALLSYADGDVPNGQRIAERHTRTVLSRCVDRDGAAHIVTDGRSARQHVKARGQAWAMLGSAVAADRFGEEFYEPARRTATWWLDHVPGTDLPPAEIGPGSATTPPSRDSSAAAIAVAALTSLAKLPLVVGDEATRFRLAASVLTRRLVDEHLDGSGVLRDGCYDSTRRIATSHELIWGTYFLTAALAIHCGHVDSVLW